MQYLRALQKRSIFLWRSLFSEESETGESSPDYIERPTAARAAEGQKDTESAPDLGAAVSDQDKSRPIKTDREEKDGAAQLLEKQMLRGLTEAEMWVVSVDDKTGIERSEPLMAGAADAGKNPPESRLAGDSEISSGALRTGAEQLLGKLRRIDGAGGRARAAGRSGAETAPQISGPAAAAAGPAEISAWFEADARRYDGAYEVM